MEETNIQAVPDKVIIPRFLINTLTEHGIGKEDVRFTTECDLSVSYIRCESHIIVTDEKIHIFSGNLGLSEKNKTNFFSRKKYKENFNIIEHAEFVIAEYTDFSFEEQISSAVISAKHNDNGTTHVIACATNSMKVQLTGLKDYLSSLNDECEKFEHDEKHQSHLGHGKPPFGMPPKGHGRHGGPGGRPNDKMSPKGPMYCPKCGKKFSDPRRRICLHCMEKGKVIKRLFSFVIKYKFQVIATIMTLLFTGALGIITPYVSSGFYYDKVLTKTGEFYGEILLAISLIIGTKVLSTIVTIVNNLINSRIAANLQYDLKNVIFSSIERLSLRYFTDKQTGGLMNQVNNDARTIYWFFTGGIPYYLVNIVQIISVVIIMFIIEPKLTLMYLATVPFIFFMSKFLFTSMGKFHNHRFVTSRKLNAIISDTFSGMRVVKAFSKEKSGSERFADSNERSAAAERTASRFSTINFPLPQILMLISNALVLGFGGWMVIGGRLEYGELMTFTAYTAMIYSPMQSFVHMTYEATDSLNAMSRLVEVCSPVAQPGSGELAADRPCSDP